MDEYTYTLKIEMSGDEANDINYDLLKADFERMVKDISIQRGDSRLKVGSLVEA